MTLLHQMAAGEKSRNRCSNRSTASPKCTLCFHLACGFRKTQMEVVDVFSLFEGNFTWLFVVVVEKKAYMFDRFFCLERHNERPLSARNLQQNPTLQSDSNSFVNTGFRIPVWASHRNNCLLLKLHKKFDEDFLFYQAFHFQLQQFEQTGED